jgi:toxin CcdB
MAQFDVHRNRGQNHDAIPYVVILQSSIFDDYRRRVRFNPTFKIEKTPVVLHPLEIVSVDKNKLGPLVQSLADDGQRFIDALDELITRAHG